jgi:hypothetical protein
MKFLIIAIVLSIISINAKSQNMVYRFSINMKLQHPVLTNQDNDYNYSVDPGLELLSHHKLNNTVKFSTGIGFMYGEHNWFESVSGLVWRDDFGWWPFSSEYTRRHSLFDLSLPLYFEAKTGASIIHSAYLGIIPGYRIHAAYFGKNQSYYKIPTKFDRFYTDVNLGIAQRLIQFNGGTISLAPFIGYRILLSDNNDWQYNSFVYGINISSNF